MTNNAKYIGDDTGRVFFGERGAAGCFVLSQKTGRLMLGLRSDNVQEPGTWGTWGGAIEEGSNPRRTAFDELFEETGHNGKIRLEPLSVFKSADGSFAYHNFLAIVEDEYEPWASHESDGFEWFNLGDWPQPAHFGVEYILGDMQTMDKITDFVRRAKKGEDLISEVQQPPERTLYHCLYRAPEGEMLNPTCVRKVNGREERFLFAASYFAKALAFAFSYHSDKGEIICNGGIDGSPDEFAIICNRGETLNMPRHIRVFSFSSNNFEQAWNAASRQYVSIRPVDFQNTQLVFETQNVEDLMRKGLQIFSTDKTFEELMAENFHETVGLPANSNNEWLRNLVRDEGFLWENQQRGVNPNQILLVLFEQGQARENCVQNQTRVLSASSTPMPQL